MRLDEVDLEAESGLYRRAQRRIRTGRGRAAPELHHERSTEGRPPTAWWQPRGEKEDGMRLDAAVRQVAGRERDEGEWLQRSLDDRCRTIEQVVLEAARECNEHQEGGRERKRHLGGKIRELIKERREARQKI